MRKQLSASRVILFLLETREIGVLLAVILLSTFLAFATPYFLSTFNLMNVLRQVSVVGILAVGQTMVLISGNIDLSIGAQLGLSGCVVAILTLMGFEPLLALIIAICTTMSVGLVNGLLTTKIGISSFIVTLGMMGIVRGASLMTTGGLPARFDGYTTFLGEGYMGVIPVPVLIFLGIALVAHVFLSRTVIGKRIYGVGSNAMAARLYGIKVDKIRILCFMITGALCGIGGILLAGNLRSANPTTGIGYELDVIAASIIGGTSFTGGEGTIIGTVIGAMLLGIIRNSFILLRISAYWQSVTLGSVVIAAVILDSIRERMLR